MTFHRITPVLLLAVSAAFIGCGTGNNENENTKLNEDSTDVQSVSRLSKAQNVFFSLASPVETASLIKKTGVPYNKDFLNPIENVNKYTTINSRALNLGVYGTDLSMASIFEQSQESMLYLKCTNSLASDLGISAAFGEKTIARMESNINNKDSLMNIISDAFLTSDTYLKENDRPNTSALIIAGGWIEGLYISIQIAKTSNNADILNRIAEQKLSIGNLIALLESYGEDKDIAPILADMKDLKTAFDGVQLTKGKVETTNDAKTGMATLGSKATITMTKEQLNAIAEKTENIRKKITS